MSKYNKDSIIQLYQQNLAIADIAKTLGIPEEAASYHIYSSIKRGLLKKRPNTRKAARHNRSKLTEADVLGIYELDRKGYSVMDILRATPKISDESTIRSILKGKNWKELYMKYYHPKSP